MFTSSPNELELQKPIASGLNLVFLRLPESLAFEDSPKWEGETREPEEHRHLGCRVWRAAFDMGPCVREQLGLMRRG